MQLILYLDSQGLVRVDLVTIPEEREIAHVFWRAVHPLVIEFDAAVQRLNFSQEATSPESRLNARVAQKEKGTRVRGDSQGREETVKKEKSSL